MIEQKDAHSIVVEISNKCQLLMIQEIRKHNPSENQEWLLIGRVINLIFSSFYNPMIAQSKKFIVDQDSGNKT